MIFLHLAVSIHMELIEHEIHRRKMKHQKQFRLALMSQVGLRWWNFINDEGKSEWKFESRNSNDPTGCANKSPEINNAFVLNYSI